MATVPPSTPPMAYHEKALPVLVSVSSSDFDDLTALGHAISILARLRLQHRTTHDIQPLKLLLRRSETNAASFGMGLILNAVVAYPLHLKAISTIVTRVLADQPSFLDEIRREVIPSLVSRLRLSSSTPEMGSTIAVLLSVTRAHEELLGLALTEADYILPTLKEIYPKLGNGDKKCIRYRSDVLLLCHSLVTVLPGQGTSRDALKRLMGDGVGTSKKVLVDGALRSDYEAVFERKSGLGDEELANLADLRIDDTRADPRLAPLTNLFPHISPLLLSEALEHPQFCSLSPDYEEAAAPLIHEILTGGTSLPAELSDLRDAISQGSPQQANGASGAPRSAASSFVSHNQPASSMGAKKKKIERRNIWDDEELDFSRLSLGKDDSSLEIGNTIPDQLRASIMRLVESQAEEEAERERALKDAGHRSFVAASRAVVGGVGSDDVEGEDEAGRDRVKIGKDGEESGEDEDAQDQKVIGSSNPPSSVGLYDVDQQSKLELAYLANPKLFDRDSKTRKSDARKRLREITGMADEQIEGWKIMLERNPHKDAILSRHTFTPAKNYLTPSSASSVVSGSNAGRGKGKGSEGSRGGGGSSRGGRGGGSGRGGGGGGEGSSVGGSRGGRGASRGNRGHSNAARTRGHDKKMAKMGAGV